jgi:hypothetical protein
MAPKKINRYWLSVVAGKKKGGARVEKLHLLGGMAMMLTQLAACLFWCCNSD